MVILYLGIDMLSEESDHLPIKGNNWKQRFRAMRRAKILELDKKVF